MKETIVLFGLAVASLLVLLSRDLLAQDTVPKFCPTVVLKCGATPSFLCQDADTLTDAEKEILKKAALRIAIQGKGGKPFTAQNDGEGTGFNADSLCNSDVAVAGSVQVNGAEAFKTTVQLARAGGSADAPAKKVPPPPQCRLSAIDWSTIHAAIAGGGEHLMIVSYGSTGLPTHLGRYLLDGTPDNPRIVLPPTDTSGGVIGTNARLWIWVIRPDHYPSQVAVDGAPQETGPVIQSSTETGAATGGGSVRDGESAPPSFCQTDVWSAAPRAAGGIKITTQLIDLSGDVYKPSQHVSELVVEAMYIGALRFGVAGVVPFAQNGRGWGTSTYVARPVSTGGTAIYEDSWAPAEIELVGGYTAFFSRRRLSALADGGWGLFGGLGLAAVSPVTGNVTGLTSAYVGLERSWNGLQVLLLAGLRREPMLSSAYHEGDHVASSTSLMGTEVLPAAGVMLGFTSDVLRIQGGSAR